MMKILVVILGFLAQDYPDHVGIVNDFAMELDTDSKERIERAAAEGKQKADVRLVVVTVRSLGGQSVEAYTIGLAKKWGVGEKGKNNGIVLLHAPKERKIRIENGYGAESRLTDIESKMIIERMIPLMKAGNFAKALAQASEEIIRTVAAPEKKEEAPEKESARSASQTAAAVPSEKPSGDGTGGIVLFGVTILVALLIMLAWIVRSGARERALEEEARRRRKKSPDLPTDPLAGPLGISGLGGLQGPQGISGLGVPITPIVPPVTHIPFPSPSTTVADDYLRRRQEEQDEEDRRRRRRSSDSSSSSSSSWDSSSSSSDSSSFGGGDFGGGGASGDY